MKIAAIVVTCNRKNLLHILLKSLMNMTRKPDAIIVVDNGSNDGTGEFVRTHFPAVTLISLKHNYGLFAGLEIGVKTAFCGGYDAVWLLDDDALPGEDALEELLRVVDSDERLRNAIVYSANVAADGQLFTEPVTVMTKEGPRSYSAFVPELAGKVFEKIGAGPNIGVYIPRCVIELVGTPRADMVFCGEIEYIQRAKRLGIRVYQCFSSIIYHKQHRFVPIKVFNKTWYVSVVPAWHAYYEVRNSIYTLRLYKLAPLWKVMAYMLVSCVIRLLNSENKPSMAISIMRGIYDGLFGKLGMRMEIPR